MQFVGVSERNYLARQNVMNEVCYSKVSGRRHVHYGNIVRAYTVSVSVRSAY